MKKRRLIAVITGVCCNDYQQSIINGITQQCRNLNCDTAVFNFFSNFDEDNPHQNAENNIFKLINYRLFDGVIFDSQLILKSSTRRSIENDIIASGIPAMQIYFSENDRLQGVPVNDAAAFEQITDHIIDVHGCSRLFCLTAYQNEYCSEQRLQGFINSLKKHGITVVRHNLRDEPQMFVSNKAVNDYLKKYGAESLPITLVDGEIAVSKNYPSTKQMSEWTGINLDFMPVK